MAFCYFGNERINNDIKNYLQRRIKAYGDLRYAYLLFNKKLPLHLTIISNYPETWVKKYKQYSFHLVDPVIITARNRISPFAWDDNGVINIKSIDPAVFDLAKEHHIIHGYTFVLHDHNDHMAALSLYSDQDESVTFDEHIEKCKNNIQMLLIKTHNKVLELYEKGEIVENLLRDQTNMKNTFSRRENEILYWASIGKTYYEIAIILGIKKSTVKFHMGNIVNKLGVLNAKHAIRLGVELQLIRPIEG